MTRALRAFLLQMLIGSSLLVIAASYDLYSHLAERNARRSVLAQGQSATALMQQPMGREYVTVSWTDASGSRRSGRAWTSKRFARELQARVAVAGSLAVIKYVDNARFDPVILAEAKEREQINDGWIITSGIAALLALVMTAAAGRAYLISRMPQPTPSLKRSI